MARSLERRGRRRGLIPPGRRAVEAWVRGCREACREECRCQARGALFPLATLTLFLLAFLGMAGARVHVADLGPHVLLNAPLAIVAAQYVLAVPAAFAGAAFVAAAMARGAEGGAGGRARPALPLAVLLGRLAAGALAAFLCACGGLAGALVGARMPWLDPQRLGPLSAMPYWHALWTVVAPNAFIASAVASVVAVHARAVYPTCAAALALLVLVAAAGMVADPATVALLDPLGTTAFAETIRHWTVLERNALAPTPSGSLLESRLVWIGLALASLAIAAWRGTTPGRPLMRAAAPTRARRPPGGVPRQLFRQVAHECAWLLRCRSSMALLAAALVYVCAWTGRLVAGGFVPPALPLGSLLGGLEGNALLPVQLVLVGLAGALVYRHGPGAGTGLGAQAGALCVAVVGLLTLGGLAGAWDVADARLDLAVHLLTLYGVFGWELAVFAAVSVAVHALAGSRLAGTLTMLLLLLWQACAVGLGFEHVLYRLRLPEAPCSQMNGYGHFVEPLITVGAYWSAFAVLLGVCGNVLKPERGGAALWFAVASQRCTPTARSVAALAGVAWIGLGAWIFYNTNVLNAYETEADIAARRAEYERRFGAHADLPRPEPVAVDLVVDIYPERRALRSRGTVLLGNTGATPITDFVVSFPRGLRIATLAVPATLVERADALGIRRYMFDPPLRPTERVRMAFDVSREHVGFRHRGAPTGLVANGTFLAGRDVVPSMGYDASFELADGHARRRHGLPPAEARADGRPGMSGGTRVRVRLGTSLDQVGVAPGRLVRAWREEDRSYFEYEADRLAWPFLWVRSGREPGIRPGGQAEGRS